MPRAVTATVSLVALAGCTASPPAPAASPATAAYLDYTGQPDVLSGGARQIAITTPKGEFHVWTKGVGNNPRIKVLLLHGGPGATHEYFERGSSS